METKNKNETKITTIAAGSELYESMADSFAKITGTSKEKVVKELGTNPVILTAPLSDE